MKDYQGYIIQLLSEQILEFRKIIRNRLTGFECLVKGISLGSSCGFYGKTYLNRFPNSKIIIGNHVRFRSSFSSNLIGLNRPCMLSTVRKGALLEIGDSVGLSGAVIGCANHIKIGNNVLGGANVVITDFDWHPIIRHTGTLEPAEAKPVIIGDYVWLGLNSVILKGVTIGENSVIGANSVVTKSIPANVIAAGNPCKVIKEIQC